MKLKHLLITAPFLTASVNAAFTWQEFDLAVDGGLNNTYNLTDNIFSRILTFLFQVGLMHQLT